MLGLSANTRSPHDSHRTYQGWGVKRTNTDLPNTYRRSITETIMHPIGKNILLTYPHFGFDFLQRSFDVRGPCLRVNLVPAWHTLP